MKTTPVPALVPRESGWAPGIHHVWAERSADRPKLWVYLHTSIEKDAGLCGWSSETGCFPQRFKTKAEAILAGVRYIKVAYHG